MSRAVLTVTGGTTAGSLITYNTPGAGAGNGVTVAGATHVLVKNGAGSPITVTLYDPQTVDGNVVADRSITVNNGTDKLIKLAPYEIQSDGSIYLDFSSGTSILVAGLVA